MRESCTSGSVRGASSDRRLYSTLQFEQGGILTRDTAPTREAGPKNALLQFSATEVALTRPVAQGLSIFLGTRRAALLP